MGEDVGEGEVRRVVVMAVGFRIASDKVIGRENVHTFGTRVPRDFGLGGLHWRA